MECPICGSLAEDTTPASYLGIVIVCPKCGEFQITACGLKEFSDQGLERRTAALSKARRLAPRKVRPAISRSCI
jgi:hypothetical protein